MDFVKGHMGGNAIVLLFEGDILPSAAADNGDATVLAAALAALDPLCLGGHQAGILSRGKDDTSIRLRVVSCSWRDFIPACGGLTQVLGKAVIEAGVGERLGLSLAGSPLRLILEFDCGPVPIEVEAEVGRVHRVVTHMTSFVKEATRSGIEKLDLDGVSVVRVGTFLILDSQVLRQTFRDTDFEVMNTEARDAIIDVQKRFQKRIGLMSWDVVLYDEAAAGHGDIRVLFPHRLPTGHVEASCGTGSVALALALGRPELALESGGDPVLGGPDVTKVTLDFSKDCPVGARFTHDRVQILARGTLSPNLG